MATFVEIMQKIGLGKCRMQYMEHTLTNIKTNKKNVTTITWQTSAENLKINDLHVDMTGHVHYQGEMMPIVLWVPRKEWDEACKE